MAYRLLVLVLRSDAGSVELIHDAANAPAPRTPMGDSIGTGPFGKLADLATWADILEPAGWMNVPPSDSATVEAWVHPAATHPISAHVLKINPHVLVNWSTNSGLPEGADQDLTKGRVYAHLWHHGDESAAATAMLKGEAAHLPPHRQEAAKGTRSGGAWADLEGLISHERLENLIKPDIPAWNHPPVGDPTPEPPPSPRPSENSEPDPEPQPNAVTEDTPGPEPSTDWEADFWGSRRELNHAFDFALARRVSPWALLGWTLVSVVYHVPPWIKLPPIIGSHASLNLFAAMVAPSGKGKSVSFGAAQDAFILHVNEVYTAPAGSGEGLVKQYAHWSAKEGGQADDRDRVLFTASEVDTLAALKSRCQGPPCSASYARAYSGEALGFAYSDNHNKIRLASHAYRLCFVVGVQPERADALLNDAELAGGTPQRFGWFQAVDGRITVEARHCPNPLVIQKSHGPWKSEEFTIPVCSEAEREIVENHVKNQQGEADAIDGHSLQTREKVAAALAILNDPPGRSRST